MPHSLNFHSSDKSSTFWETEKGIGLEPEICLFKKGTIAAENNISGNTSPQKNAILFCSASLASMRTAKFWCSMNPPSLWQYCTPSHDHSLTYKDAASSNSVQVVCKYRDRFSSVFMFILLQLDLQRKVEELAVWARGGLFSVCV